MFSTSIAILFALLLVAGVPALSYFTSRNPEIRTVPRLSLYASAIFSQWLLTAIGLGVALMIARKVLVTGFAAVPLGYILKWSSVITLAALVALVVVIFCERRGWMPPESDLVHLLIPETSREKLWSALIVAPTAAFCEEFLFRGYLLSQFHDWLHSMGWAWIVCSVVFGLAHSYQGWSGMTRAGLLGALLAYPVVRSGSLYPSILAHWMIDVVALVWLGPWMIRNHAGSHGINPEGDANLPPVLCSVYWPR